MDPIAWQSAFANVMIHDFQAGFYGPHLADDPVDTFVIIPH